MVDILTPLAAYGAAQYVIPRALSVAAKIKLAYDVGHWLGSQARAGVEGAQAGAPPAHNPSAQVDAFLAALGGAPKKRRKRKNRYTELVKKEMKRYNEKGMRGKNLPAKEKFRLAANRAKKEFDKEQKDGKKKARKKATS